jgi:hypothetical protein
MLRWLRTGLAAAILAPLLAVGLVVGSPQVASAAASYGPVVHGTVKAGDGRFPEEVLSCDVGAAYKVDGSDLSVVFTADCDRNASLSAGMAITIGYLEPTLRFSGTKSDGFSCGGSYTWQGTEPSGQQSTGATVATCVIDAVCLSWITHDKFSPDGHAAESCEALPMGDPPAAAADGCAFGTPSLTYSNPPGSQYVTLKIHSTSDQPQQWYVRWQYPEASGNIYGPNVYTAAANTDTSFQWSNGWGGQPRGFDRWCVSAGGAFG